jgi:AraC family transcriptional regulator
MSDLSIIRKEVAAQPLLLIRRTTTRATLAEALGDCFGKLFSLGHAQGLPVSGWPVARYVSMGPGPWTIEAAMPVSGPVSADKLGDAEIQAGTLHAGAVAFAVHCGSYQGLPQTHAAIEEWIRAQGYEVAGAPWESYVTDPGKHANSADWKTEVFWPLKA